MISPLDGSVRSEQVIAAKSEGISWLLTFSLNVCEITFTGWSNSCPLSRAPCRTNTRPHSVSSRQPKASITAIGGHLHKPQCWTRLLRISDGSVLRDKQYRTHYSCSLEVSHETWACSPNPTSGQARDYTRHIE